MIFHNVLEEGISYSSSFLLHIFTFFWIFRMDVQRNAQLLCEGFEKILVSITFSPSQLKIHVGKSDLKSESVQDMGKCYAITAAANCHKKFGILFERFLILEV